MKMIGAICGDVIGSAYEWHSTKREDFELFSPRTHFTDDSVLTVAVADCLLNGKDYSETLLEYGRNYPGRGYGGRFSNWLLKGHLKPYGSFGNGSAMRVSAVGWAKDNLDDVLHEAEKTALPTHNHPEGIKGAQATAASVFLARKGNSREEIRDLIQEMFGYDLERKLEDIRPSYSFDVTCQGSVPESIMAFLESSGYEDAIRKAISLGGDADTQACIAGGIAEAFYGEVPSFIQEKVLELLPEEFKEVLSAFEERFITRS